MNQQWALGILGGLLLASCAATAPPQWDTRIDPRLVKASEIAEQRALHNSVKLCWRYVKDALLEARVINERPQTVYATEVAKELTEKYGFLKLPQVKTPFEAPVGSVLVYVGRYIGHVEFRTQDGFASDYFSSRPCYFGFQGAYALLSPGKTKVRSQQSEVSTHR
jgi:hypothetical protein